MKIVPNSSHVRSSKAEPLLPGPVPDFKKPVARSRTIRIDFRDLAIQPESLMDKFVIRGGNPLVGSVRISGAKNAALPAMAAAMLTDEPVILENIPAGPRYQTERKLLVAMGAEVELGYGRAHHRTTICCRNLANPEAAYELVKTMRASTLVLGPLVARMGRARVSLPGRLRHWRPPHRSAHQRAGAPGRNHHAGAWLHRGQRRAAARRADCLRQDHRHRHGRPA